MEIPTLYIKPKRYSGESSVVTLRIAKDMVKDFDDIALSTGRTRNEIMSLCLEFAMEHMKIITPEHQETGGQHNGSN